VSQGWYGIFPQASVGAGETGLRATGSLVQEQDEGFIGFRRCIRMRSNISWLSKVTCLRFRE
jgi:hypothetical protein